MGKLRGETFRRGNQDHMEILLSPVFTVLMLGILAYCVTLGAEPATADAQQVEVRP